MSQVPLSEGLLDTETQSMRMSHKDEGRDQMMVQMPRGASDFQCPLESNGPGTDPSAQTSEETNFVAT